MTQRRNYYALLLDSGAVHPLSRDHTLATARNALAIWNASHRLGKEAEQSRTCPADELEPLVYPRLATGLVKIKGASSARLNPKRRKARNATR